MWTLFRLWEYDYRNRDMELWHFEKIVFGKYGILGELDFGKMGCSDSIYSLSTVNRKEARQIHDCLSC